jgi:hypothetical protein
LPAEGEGPRVTALESPNNTVRAGQRGKLVSGRTDERGYAVAMGLEGDAGWWVVPLGARAVLAPGEIEYEAGLDFSLSTPPGRRTLVVQATDREGRYGPRARLPLTFTTALPDAPLVVQLQWDTDADLNLRVLQPDGNELTVRGLRSPTGAVVSVMPRQGPQIDGNSNEACRIDGRRIENGLWAMPSPGRYHVRVETWSLCGQSSARWTLRVFRQAVLLAEATGASFDVPVPTTGQGLQALTFDLAP